ncbi:hypothetical protein BU17DRAFT_79707 [Hysterangium stoloniferum]|nr:hypothetical protein BU17DRAFT_79704 [Hysterangium stoloniferum]KAF8529653.1 hypothetical protein BU17DRAFT_79707 [Hysterangium stoloniferum]
MCKGTQASRQQARLVVVSSLSFISGSQDGHLRIWITGSSHTSSIHHESPSRYSNSNLGDVTMQRLVQGYVLGTEWNMSRVDVCEINAKSGQEGQSSAGRVWSGIAGLLGVKPKKRKEETAAVWTLLLLDTDGRQGQLQSTLHLSPHDRPHSVRIQLSPNSDSTSPRVTPSPSPRANPIALPSEPPT